MREYVQRSRRSKLSNLPTTQQTISIFHLATESSPTIPRPWKLFKSNELLLLLRGRPFLPECPFETNFLRTIVGERDRRHQLNLEDMSRCSCGRNSLCSLLLGRGAVVVILCTICVCCGRVEWIDHDCLCELGVGVHIDFKLSKTQIERVRSVALLRVYCP